MLAVLALVASANAADVLLLDATPVTLDDFSVAGLFYGMVVSAADDQGLDYEDADAIHAWAGEDADTCWDNEACPSNLWERTEARLALVMSVEQTAGGLQVEVRLHGADETSPFKVLKETVRSGGESAYAQVIARAARDALPLLPSRKPVGGPVLVIEDEVILGPNELPDLDDRGREPDAGAGREPTPKDDPPTTRSSTKEPREDSRAPRDGNAGRANDAGRDTRRDGVQSRLRADDDRRRMGVPARAYARYEASGLGRDEWLAKSRVRAGHGFLEIGGGWALGDVNRGYGVRLRITEASDSFETLGTSSWEGAGAGSAPAFGFALGYAPAWYLDTSVAVAVQYGQKYLNTGWECSDLCDPPASEYPHDPVGAVQAFVEPRLRLYPLATGLVKPYALFAFSVLFHDGFTVPDPDFVDYPDAPAGASLGATAGLGVAVDAIPRLGFYVEVPGTLLFTPSTVVDEGEVTLDPDALLGAGYVVRFTGGIVVRL